MKLFNFLIACAALLAFAAPAHAAKHCAVAAEVKPAGFGHTIVYVQRPSEELASGKNASGSVRIEAYMPHKFARVDHVDPQKRNIKEVSLCKHGSKPIVRFKASAYLDPPFAEAEHHEIPLPLPIGQPTKLCSCSKALQKCFAGKWSGESNQFERLVFLEEAQGCPR